MKLRLLILCTICVGIACTAFADTLHLTNGQVITGTFLGRSSAGVQFIGPDGTSQIYPSEQVESVSFGPIPASVQPVAPAPQQVMVPAGTILLVRMVDGLDTKTAYSGQLFTATLSSNLAANGYVAAPSGTTVYGEVVEAKSAGRISGASQLKLQLTQIIIGGNAIPIITDVFDSQKGKSSTHRSLFRTLGGAGLGAAIGAIAGNAGMGAAIGGVAGGVGSVVQRGDQIEIPSEAQLEFHLTQPVTLPVTQ
ncbi:MAG: hypothetical protein ABSA29_00795 [Terriglobales bacterium]|jgi:hypothetical protein